MAENKEDLERFKDLDFEELRAMFTDTGMADAFFANIGVIKGRPDLDISKFCESESQNE